MTNEEIQLVRKIVQEELAGFLGTRKYNFENDLKIFDGKNIQLGRTIGTKIGTATDQKIGFFGATPVDKPEIVSDSTGDDAAAVNAIIDRLQELGLIK